MADPRDLVTLAIDGQLYSGWKAVEIVTSLDSLSGSFQLTLAERGAADDRPFPFRADAACEVRVGDETLINGWIDRLGPAFDEGSHGIVISGRDRSADLIDCSAVHKPGSWRNTSIEAIAAELAKPFGITVTARASTAPKLKAFALQQGETVFEAIERMLRYRGLLAVSTPDGNVEIVTPEAGAAVERIVQGGTIRRANAEHDVTERFSHYLLKGQASGDDEANGRTVSAPSADARDPAVKRYRPLIVIGEEQSDRGSLAKRAQWEATVRAARSQTAIVTVPGWRTPGGALRRHGMTFELAAPWLFMTGKMLAAEVTLSLAEDSRNCTLRLVPPEAYSQLKVPETADASKVAA